MIGYMYILECADGSYYTGSTKDIEKRIAEHQNGLGANHTKKRLPVTLVYYEKYDRIDTAFYREKQVQGWSRAKKEALIKGEVDELHKLSECQNETHWLERYSSAFDCAQASEQNSNPERSRRVNNENENQAVTEPFDTAQDKLSRRVGRCKKEYKF
ncbi:GIY-YIG nuclease family protein [Aquimarina brevivitae]|uniref:Putative endonuclease n=1 Tax=Aquimarina brevivitae TaxID=323412 RepID=A0A4Q7P2M0_9FLAO|nr:GIY-YIG nuclease family protein [Aquimarina brevivitae]RZS93857.1 putative endonuclease [Aquimarina brevivitae]